MYGFVDTSLSVGSATTSFPLDQAQDVTQVHILQDQTSLSNYWVWPPFLGYPLDLKIHQHPGNTRRASHLPSITIQ